MPFKDECMTETAEAYMLKMACRAAVNQSTPEGLAPPINELQARVSKNFDTLRDGATNASSMLSNKTTAAAIAVTVVAGTIVVAASVINEEWNTVSKKNAKLKLEIKQRVSMFGVREIEGERTPTFEQKLIRSYYLKLDSDPALMRYSGIRRIEPANPGDKTMYFVLPFYLMGQKALKPLGSMNAVDRVSTIIDTFLTVQIPEALESIEAAFSKPTPFVGPIVDPIVAIGKSVTQKGNFLNNWRSARFMIITLGNLLWNLQHPGDLRTGRRVSLDECSKYCKKVLDVLMALLNPQEAPYLVHKDLLGRPTEESKQLVKFITSVKLLVENLHEAYLYDQSNTIDLADLTNTSHRVLETLNTVLFKLLYQRYSEEAGILVPDENAADILSARFNELTLILRQKNEITNVFQPYVGRFSKIPYLNANVTTLIDILIIFTHLPWSDRSAVMTALKVKMEQRGEPSWGKFAEVLEALDARFIQPVANVDQTNYVYQTAASAKTTGQRLLPFFTLLMAALRTNVDTGSSYQLAQDAQQRLMEDNPDVTFDPNVYDDEYEESELGNGVGEVSQPSSWSTEDANLDPTLKMQRTGKQQIAAINTQAREAAGSSNQGYFSWRVALFLQRMKHLSPRFREQINGLALEEENLIDVIGILDSLAALLVLDPIVLQKEDFKQFFLRYLDKIKIEFKAFNAKLTQAGIKIAANEAVSLEIQSIYNEMIQEMDVSLNAVNIAVLSLESTVSNPGFMDTDRKSFATQVRSVERNFVRRYPDEERPGLIYILRPEDEELGNAVQTRYAVTPTEVESKAKKSMPRRMLSAFMSRGKSKQQDDVPAREYLGGTPQHLESSPYSYSYHHVNQQRRRSSVGQQLEGGSSKRGHSGRGSVGLDAWRDGVEQDGNSHHHVYADSDDDRSNEDAKSGGSLESHRSQPGSHARRGTLQRQSSALSNHSGDALDVHVEDEEQAAVVMRTSQAHSRSRSPQKMQRGHRHPLLQRQASVGDNIQDVTSPRGHSSTLRRHVTWREEPEGSQKNEAQTVALQLWMEQCLEHMSSLSRYEYKNTYVPSLCFGGHKGLLLRTLMDKVSDKSELSDEELAFYFLNLVRLAASYRETPFGLFQAEWGKTRAMAPILKVIKNPTYNRMFPFKKLLFQDRDIDLDLLSEDEIVAELKHACMNHKWELSEDKIKEDTFVYTSTINVMA
jgi:hypothetical protein